jgi:transcriptional regulator with XRE-family HTH domain
MHVYIVQRPDGLIKIGFSTDPTKRLRSLETQGGFDAASAWVSVPVENAKAVEAKAHEKLAEHRVIGEWFKADFDDAIQTVVDVLSGKFTDEISASWNDNARAIARERGITIAQLAQALNVTPGCVGHWLSGRRTASVEEAERIAAALGVTLQDLLSPSATDESMPTSLTGLFARHVRKAMNDAGLVQTAVAAAAGVSQKNVSDVVNGEKSPTLSTVQKLCEALDLGCVIVAPGCEQSVSRAAELLANLSTEHRAQALRMLEAFAASCANYDQE